MMTEILLGAAVGYNLAKRYLVPYIATKYDEYTEKRKKEKEKEAFDSITPVYPDVFKKKEEAQVITTTNPKEYHQILTDNYQSAFLTKKAVLSQMLDQGTITAKEFEQMFYDENAYVFSDFDPELLKNRVRVQWRGMIFEYDETRDVYVNVAHKERTDKLVHSILSD